MSDSEEGVSRRGFLRAATAGATAAAGATGAAAAQEGTTTAGGDGTTTAGEGNATTTAGGGGNGGGQTVTVNLVDYAYEPGTEEPLRIAPGTTVKFVWETNTHNINVDSQPEGANWQGHMPVEGAGFTYTHTFDTLGTYEFHCDPHVNLGMKGTIVVTQNPQAGGGGYQSILPDSAKTLGVATVGAMASVLGLAYFFLRYGGEYGDLPEQQ